MRGGVLLSIIVMSVTYGSSALAQQGNNQPLYSTNPANALFTCERSTMDQLACQAGALCKCVYEPFGNAMKGLPPDSYRWDCNPIWGTCLVDAPNAVRTGNGRRGVEQRR